MNSRISAGLAAYRPIRRLTRSNLLILCYHGFSLDDEADFNPAMFMKPETFRARMEFLAQTGWPVLSLHEALRHLSEGDLPDGAVVITADDGWAETAKIAKTVLKPLDFPMTNYITTHYVAKQLPVSNMMLSYLLWKSSGILAKKPALNIAGETIDNRAADPQQLRRILVGIAEPLDASGRDYVNAELAAELEIDYSERKQKRLFHLMDEQELADAANAGVDIQLHGDRHLGGRSLEDETLFKREVSVNREKLSRYANSPLEHFCYPSGACHPRQIDWLKELAIRSATTCDPGLNYPSTNEYQLRRFLDREDISLSRFVIELTGIRGILRRHR